VHGGTLGQADFRAGDLALAAFAAQLAGYLDGEQAVRQAAVGVGQQAAVGVAG
jgi:hypothetical protein